MPTIKHPPHKLAGGNTIYLSTRTPLVSGIKRVSRHLSNKTAKSVVVVGAGKAIQKVLCLALELRRQGYLVDVYTKTLKVYDEIIDEDSAEAPMKERLVGAVELKVRNPARSEQRSEQRKR